MRRKLAYIFLSAAIVFGAAATVGPTLISMDSDVTYAEGKDLYYRISTKGTSYQGVLPENYIENDDYVGVSAVAKEMEARLENWGVNATVSKEGYDTVKVSIRAQEADATEYTYLENYLAFSGGDITITAGTSVASLQADADKQFLGDKYIGNAMFKNQSASITYVNNVPVVTIPVNSTGKDGDLGKLISFCTSNTKSADSSTGQTATNVYLVLWANRQEGDNYADAASSSSTGFDANMSKRLFFGENASNAWYDDADSDKDYKTFQMVPNSEALTENGYDSSKSGAAYKAAFYYMNLMNASSYGAINSIGYDVTFAYSVDMPATVENLISNGDWARNPAFGATMLACLLCLAIGIFILAFYYRLGSLGILSSVAVSIIGSLLLFAYFHAQFGVGALLGIVLGAIGSSFGAVYYFAKFKEEIYKGRGLKKAHSEAIKKALWPSIDEGLISIIIGLCVYGFVSSTIGKMGLMLVFTGFFGAVANILLLRLEGWLLANDSSVEKSLSQTYGVDPDKVPDAMKDEKQGYFGPYATTNFQKHSKIVGVLAGLAIVASIVGISVFSGLSGNAFNYSSAYSDTTSLSLEYRVQKNTTATLLLGDVTQVKTNYLSAISVDGKSLLDYVATDSNGNTEIYTATGETYDSGDDMTYTVYYYNVLLSKHFDLEAHDHTIILTFGTSASYDNFNLAIAESAGLYAGDSMTATSQNVVSQAGTPTLGTIYLAVGVSLAALLVYFMLRFKMSRGIIATLLAAASGVVVAGVFALSRLTVSPVVSLSIIATTFLGFLLALFMLNKEKEIEKESREKDKTSLEFKSLCLKQANAQSAGDMIVFSLVIGGGLIALWGFAPSVWNYAFIGSMIGFVVSLTLLLILLEPLSVWLAKLLKKIHIDFHPFKKETPVDKTGGKKKSAEPEEAVFIGIND